MSAPLDTRDWERISAYLDHQLSAREQEVFEQDLKTRADLRQGVEELRLTQALLKAAPRKKAPRNFTLTRAMLGETSLEAPSAGFFSWFPALRLASMLATLAFVLSFAFEWVLSPAAFTVPAASRSSAPQIALEAAPAQADRDSGQPTATPPIITWGPSDSRYSGAEADRSKIPAGKGGDEPEQPLPSGAPAGAPPAATAATPATAAPAAAPNHVPPAATPAPLQKSMVQPSNPEAIVTPQPSGGGASPAATAAPKAAVQPQPLAQPKTGAAEDAQENPILGLPSTQEAGKMIVPTPVLLEDTSAPIVVPPLTSSAWRGFQVILAVLALGAGLAALSLWWRHRS